MLTSDGTYWPSPKPDGFGGITTSVPVAVKTRWTEKQELVKLADGRDLISIAKVNVDLDLQLTKTGEGWGWLANTALTEIPAAILTNPLANGAFEIKAYRNLPTLRGTQFLRTAWL